MTNTWLRRPNEQVYIQTDYHRLVQQLPTVGADNAQMLMLLPFEIMRQYLESVMRRQFETAIRIYTKQAEELDNAFMTHIDKFEVVVRSEFEKFSCTRQLDCDNLRHSRVWKSTFEH